MASHFPEWVATSVANTGRPANDERDLGIDVAGRQWFDAIDGDRRGINPIVVLDNWRFHEPNQIFL
jgi:hypothetical protein